MKMVHVMGAACISMQLLAAGPTQLQKVYFHSNADTSFERAGQIVRSIEMSKLVLYFTSTPLITPLPDYAANQKKELQQKRFLIPQAELGSTEVKQMIAALSKQKSATLAITIESVKKPLSGLQITIHYDPRAISFDYDAFDTIKNQKGLAFTFYNTKCIEKLKNESDVLLQLACADRPTVVIDCGHGGSDSGALGFFSTVEKELTHTIGKQLNQLLSQQGWRVVMTRDDDSFVALDERTAIANKSNADILVSLHINHAPNHQSSGIETFFFDPCLLSNIGGMNVRENSVVKKMSDNLCKLSNHLASCVHAHVLNQARMKAPTVDRKIKRAAPQLLFGSAMPSILIELGFISNQQEAALLVDGDYQKKLVNGIVQGLNQFWESKKMVQHH